MADESEHAVKDRLARIGALVGELLATFQVPTTAVMAGPIVQNSVSNSVNPESREKGATITKFMKYNPMTINGKDGPEVAEDWILDMERIFRSLPCTEQQKGIFAADTLKGDAQRWWVRELERGTPATWEEFLARFRGKYSVEAILDQKQGGSLGLGQELRLTHPNQQGKRPFGGYDYGQGGFKRPNTWVENGSSSGGHVSGKFSRGQTQPCRSCGKFHPGPCGRMPGVCDTCKRPGHRAKNCPSGDMRGRCFICGGPGHMARNCPNRRTQKNSSLIPSANNQESVPRPAEVRSGQREGPTVATVFRGTASSDVVAGNLYTV